MASQTPATTGQAVATRDDSPVTKFQRQLEGRADDIRAALPSGISAEKFQRTILTAVAQNPDLLLADRGTLILACYKAAQDGLVPDGREAALVTFNQRKKIDGEFKTIKAVQYMPMVYGLRKKILQARDAIGQPVVSALQVGVVYRIEVENGYFLWERGSDPEVQHRPMLDISPEEASDENIVAAYSIATMSNGTRSCEVMRRFEIDQVRQMSQTGATGQTVKFGNNRGEKIEPKGPWVDWFAEMAKKTVMRRHAKTLPMSSDVIAELGGENEEQAAGRSALAVLHAVDPDAPLPITDESGQTFDGATGELIEANATAGADGDSDQGEGASQAQEPKRDQGGDAPAAEQADDGPTEHPAEKKADKLVLDMGKAKSLEALDKIYSEAEEDIGSMPDEIRAGVNAAYTRHTRRLAPKADAAKQPAQGELVAE